MMDTDPVPRPPRGSSKKTPRRPVPDGPAFHALGTEATLGAVGATEAGLASADVAARLAEHGPNRLPTRPPPGLLRIVLHQFESPLIYVLAVAAVVSAMIGEHTDAGFITAVLVLNAAIGSFQEWRAERGMHALTRYLQIRAIVVRDGDAIEIEAEQLVPGDVVLLESGNRAPADLRLLSSTGLEMDESLLTGESVPVAKDEAWCGVARTPLGDRINMVHAGSTVVRGRARGAVVATGTSTVIGALALDVSGRDQGKPPLLIRMERFTRVIAAVVVMAAVLVGGMAVLLRGYAPTDAFFLIVALAVSAIPEGLPVGLTVALSVATARMARRSVFVRRLAAVEGLGSCTFIATDKTGTLTVNQLTVREVRLADGRRFEVTGEGFTPTGEILLDGAPVEASRRASLAPLMRAAVLCNEAELKERSDGFKHVGDPTDVALLTLGHKAGTERPATLARHPLVHQIPFEPEHRFAATYHQVDGEVRVYVKGAPEQVLAMCDGATEEARTFADEMAHAGFRVLAFAEGSAPDVDPQSRPPTPRGLTFLGLVGMIDPLRPGVAEAVAQCREAGIAISMVTGDHPVTALAIARSLGLAERTDEVTTGAELEELSASQLAEKIRGTRVFARVAPQQKLEIVRAAQLAGHFVAVTGDGVNDAPALRQANIGVAMGRSGTDVAREAAELVITDDNFSSILGGVEEGRIAYDNVRKVIFLLISTGAAEVVLTGLSVGFGLPIPLLPVQLLWLNLVTNGIQHVALAFEPGEDGVMQRPPRPPSERIWNRLMIERTVIAASVMATVGFAVFASLLGAGWSEVEARNALLLLMVLFENVHIGNSRSETRSAFALSPLRSPILVAATASALLVHVVAMHFAPLQGVIAASPLTLPTWALLAGCSLSVLVAMELHKWVWRVRHGAPRAA